MQPDVKVGRTKKYTFEKKELQKFGGIKIKYYLCTVIKKQAKSKTT